MNLKTAKRRSGFTLVEVMIVVAVIGTVTGIAVPNMIRSRTTAQRNACISNLRIIDGAKEEWAFDLKKRNGDAARKSQINPYIKGGFTPKCPAGGTYRYRPVGSDPRCSVDGHELATLLDAGGGEDED